MVARLLDVSPKITAELLATDDEPDVPAHFCATESVEGIGRDMPSVVNVARSVGVNVTPPDTVTTLPTLIYWQDIAVDAVIFAVFVSVGVYVPERILSVVASPCHTPETSDTAGRFVVESNISARGNAVALGCAAVAYGVKAWGPRPRCSTQSIISCTNLVAHDGASLGALGLALGNCIDRNL